MQSCVGPNNGCSLYSPIEQIDEIGSWSHCGKLFEWEKKKKLFRGFPGDPVVKTVLPVQEAQVQSLAGKLGSHMLHVMAKNKTVIPKSLQKLCKLKVFCLSVTTGISLSARFLGPNLD